MKTEERDQLLARLDERTRNIWRTLERLEGHAKEQNGYIQELFVISNKNTIWRKIMVGTWSATISGMGAIASKMLGWW